MRSNGFGGAQFRPPSAQPALAYPRQDSSAEQAGPDLLSPPGSAGPQLPVQNGWPASGSNSTARAPGPPQFGAPRLPAGHLAGDLNNLSLNGGPAQSTSYYSQAPIGGGEYVQTPSRQQQTAAPPPPRQAGAPGQAPVQPRAGLPGRGPPAFGKPALGQSHVGPRPPGPGRPASPASPNKYASIPMPASPSPTTSGRPATSSQQQAAQMPVPPSQGRSLAPPSFSRPPPVGFACSCRTPIASGTLRVGLAQMQETRLHRICMYHICMHTCMQTSCKRASWSRQGAASLSIRCVILTILSVPAASVRIEQACESNASSTFVKN